MTKTLRTSVEYWKWNLSDLHDDMSRFLDYDGLENQLVVVDKLIQWHERLESMLEMVNEHKGHEGG